MKKYYFFAFGLLLTAFFISCAKNCDEDIPCASTAANEYLGIPQDTIRETIHDTIHDTISIISEPPDTTYFRDTLYLYKDTVYDTSYYDQREMSFIYQNEKSLLDTITAQAQNLNCEFTADSFHCRLKENSCTEVLPIWDITEITKGPAPNIKLCVLGNNCKSVVDTIRVDSSYHKKRTITLTDTIRINYGDSAQTNYIPSAQIPQIDKDSVKSWLDTLDTRLKDFGQGTFQSPYSLTGKNLPDGIRLGVDIQTSIQLVHITTNPCNITYTDYPPALQSIPSAIYNNLQEPFQNDTTITWMLIYEDQYGTKDSMEVTTVFLGSKAALF